MSPNSLRSECRKFAPNIFNKTKCSNCFKQKEEHTAEALECNRTSRAISRSGYLFVAPDWDFSVPLNRTKRWQRRWFVLYDDGELTWSVDEQPDTVPQGSVQMTQLLEVAGAEQLTGHAHSLALTGPDRVTFVKAATREDARWWAELLVAFTRTHRRNATFPGGRSLPPPARPIHGPAWSPPFTPATPEYNDQPVSSGSPPTRLRGDDKARARRDWRHERLRNLATALTEGGPSLQLPAEELLHLKKGWLWTRSVQGDWSRRWWVLCGGALVSYRDQDERPPPEPHIELKAVQHISEVQTERHYGLQVQLWSGQQITLAAVTAGIRDNWLSALRKAAHSSPPASLLLSSDEEYRTASEGERRTRGASRASTLDSVSTDELDFAQIHRRNAAELEVVKLKEREKKMDEQLKFSQHRLRETEERLKEAQEKHENIVRDLKEELTIVNERLNRGAQENDRLKRELESHRVLRVDSLSDLTNIDLDLDLDTLSRDHLVEQCEELRTRFEKALIEIRTLKKQLRDVQAQYDELELAKHTLCQMMQKREEEARANAQLMVQTKQDLAAKLALAEKQARSLKSKLQDSREKRRSLSLKGKESFSINKEVEDKVTELEAKLVSLETGGGKETRSNKSSRSSPIEDRNLRRLRRKSLDTSEPVKLFVRLNALQTKLTGMESEKKLRDEVSGAELNVIGESASGVVKQLETLLRDKLQELAAKRKLLRGSGKLTNAANLQIVAEKVAYESVLVGRIRDAMQPPTEDCELSERLKKKQLIETSQLIDTLEAKLEGTTPKSLPTSRLAVEYLTLVLTRRIAHSMLHPENKITVPSVDFSNVLNLLSDRQQKLWDCLKIYKTSHLEKLADALAVETLTLANENPCETSVAETWRLARERVNSELIQAEISHVMMRCAQSYESYNTSDHNFMFSFFASERAILEFWSDSVEDELRSEMEKSVDELTANFKVSLAKLQRENWRCRMEQERNALTARQQLADFADVVAHTALIKARMKVLSNTQNSIARCGSRSIEGGFLKQFLEHDKYWSSMEDCGLGHSDLTVLAEFRMLLDECTPSSVCKDIFSKISESFLLLAEEVAKFQGPTYRKEISNWQDVCETCLELQARLASARRYSSEIEVEALRSAYEKGILAMEGAHRRMLSELREAHSRELQLLRHEKEQALAEETQATLAALDAMRKAHEAEVQREVTKFKTDFLRRETVQDDARREILDLSERYSIKCLEAAALEEQLSAVNRQLAHAQRHILTLERSNPQLSTMQN